MSDYVPIERSPVQGQVRGPRWGLIIALILLAFVAGIALTGYAMKRGVWSDAAKTAAAAKAAPDPNFVPSLPLNANGEAPPQPVVDSTMLATREAALAGQLAALEARTASVTTDAAAASGQASRAEGMLIAFAARRAIDRGIGLGYIEEQLRQRFGQVQPRAVLIVAQAARQPVTLEDLRQGLDTIAPELTTDGNDDWIEAIRHQLATLVVLRKAGAPSPLPADRLARARRLLEGGQVDAARAEVALLPGAGDAANWMAAAKRYVLARQALDAIEGAAIMGQAPVAPVTIVPPPVVPTVTTTP